MLAAFVWTLVGALCLLVALILLPLRLRIAAGTVPKVHARVEISLLGGLSPWIGLFDSKRRRGPMAEAGNRTDKPPRRRVRERQARRRHRVDIPRVIGALPDLLCGLLTVFRVERVEVDGVFGLGDPADTGSVYGLIAPPLIAAGHALGHPGAVRVTPDFGRLTLSGKGEAEIMVRPVRAISPIVRFLWAILGPRRWD